MSIELKGVYKIYKHPAGEVVALKDVSLHIKEKEIIVLMGPSGSGKTTLLNLISGIDKPSAGQIIVDGKRIDKLNEKQLDEYRLKKIGYIFQFFNLVPTLTILENIMAPMFFAGTKYPEAEKKAKKLLDTVGLANKYHRLPDELSGGEKQRAAIATALANDPHIILADEPTGELDMKTGQKIIEILVNLSRKEGKTVIISTHDPRVTKYADRIFMIEDGEIKGEYIGEPQGQYTGLQAEEVIKTFLQTRINAIQKELDELTEKMKNGEIAIQEFTKRAEKLMKLLDAYKDEIARIGHHL